MTVKPILFSGPMVRALLDGRKTQTRRVLTRLRGFGAIAEFGASDTAGYDWHFRDRAMRWHDLKHAELRAALPCAPSDLLWVKETYQLPSVQDHRRAAEVSELSRLLYMASDQRDPDAKARPSIFMPRWASRLTLRVTEVRVQRLQEISGEECRAEGISARMGPVMATYDDRRAEQPEAERRWQIGMRQQFRDLWDGLNAKRGFGWEVSPWVVAVSFEVVRENVDAVLAKEAT